MSPGRRGATAGAKGGVASNARQGPPLLSRLIGNGPSNCTGSRFQAPGGTRLGAFQIMKWNPQSCPASVTRFRVRYDSRVSEMDTVLLRGVGAGCGSKSTSKTEGQVISIATVVRCARSHAQVGGHRRERYKLHNRCAAIPVHKRRSGKRRQYGPQSETTTSDAGPRTRQSVGRPRSS